MADERNDKIWGEEEIGISEGASCKACKDCVYRHPDPEHPYDLSLIHI